MELLDRKRWRTRVEPANAIFEYLEVFHDRRRRHSALGMLTPVEYEARRNHGTAANAGHPRASGKPGAVQSRVPVREQDRGTRPESAEQSPKRLQRGGTDR
jgi:putative transposase